jgi:hypothetical protein
MMSKYYDKLYDSVVKPFRFVFFNVFDLEARLGKESYLGFYSNEENSLEKFEQQLSALGFVRNPFSWLKSNDAYGRAESSWVKRKSLFSKKQLHFTLQYKKDTQNVHIYTHYEYNWIRHPILHLRSVDVDYTEGKRMGKELLKSQIQSENITYFYDRDISD